MHLKPLTIQGDSNVGLHVYASNEYVLVGTNFPKSEIKDMEEIFQAKVHKITIAGTNLLGVFLVGNSKKLLVPSIAFDSELKILDKLKIPYEVIHSDLTCLGNNIVATDTAALLHKDFTTKEVNSIKKALGIEKTKKITIEEVETVGSCIVINKKGGLIHRFASEKEIDTAEEVLGVKLLLGTVNLGSPLVRTGIVTNNKGFIVGKHSGGPEMVNVDEALGFLK